MAIKNPTFKATYAVWFTTRLPIVLGGAWAYHWAWGWQHFR
jgi:hypothetical protein